jgi:hypothetical protein
MSTKYSNNKNLRLHRGLLGLTVVLAQLALTPAMAAPGADSEALAEELRQGPPSALGVVAPGEMLVYSPREAVDLSTLAPFPPPEALGGQVLAGTPQLYGRVDFQQGNMMGGLFMATTGRILVTFPFTEHATIIAGKVTLTDETGKTHTYKKGDSYFIRQGSVILWDVKGDYVIKSFFNVTEPAAP